MNSAAQNVALDNQIQADFATGPLIHKVLAGFDYQRQDSTSNYKFTIASLRSTCLHRSTAPSFRRPVRLPPSSIRKTTAKQAGLYLQDQVKLDRWTLTLTGRQDWAQADTISKAFFPAAGTYLQNDKATTGRVGPELSVRHRHLALRQLLDLVRADVRH